jgi:hypothetical protein
VTLNYSDAGQLVSESFSGGPLDGMTLTNRFDALLQRTNLTVLASSSTLQSIGYEYESGHLFLLAKFHFCE